MCGFGKFTCDCKFAVRPKQCVTSRKLLSADLHYALYSQSWLGKTRQFCKTEKGLKKKEEEEGQNKADGSRAHS